MENSFSRGVNDLSNNVSGLKILYDFSKMNNGDIFIRFYEFSENGGGSKFLIFRLVKDEDEIALMGLIYFDGNKAEISEAYNLSYTRDDDSEFFVDEFFAMQGDGGADDEPLGNLRKCPTRLATWINKHPDKVPPMHVLFEDINPQAIQQSDAYKNVQMTKNLEILRGTMPDAINNHSSVHQHLSSFLQPKKRREGKTRNSLNPLPTAKRRKGIPNWARYEYLVAASAKKNNQSTVKKRRTKSL